MGVGRDTGAARSRPRPIGSRRNLNPRLTRRSFLAGTAALPLATEVSFADAAAPMELEFDLSSDGQTLIVREFRRPAPHEKSELESNWEVVAAAFGPKAWFDLAIDAGDENGRHLIIREASYGAAEAVTLDFLFRAKFGTSGKQVDHWLLELTTTRLWSSSANGSLAWTSVAQRFHDFAHGDRDLQAPTHAANANELLGQMFDGRVAVNDKTNEVLELAFHDDCLWRLSRNAGVAVTSFDALAQAGAFTLGWHTQESGAPFLLGSAKGDHDRVAVPSPPFRVGGVSAVGVSVHDFKASGGPLELELQRIASPLVPKTLQTFAKLTFGPAKLNISNHAEETASPVSAASLFVTESQLPIKDQATRRTLWGEVKRTDEDAALELRTSVGRLRVNSLKLMSSTNQAAPAQPLAPPAGSMSEQNFDALVASGDRTGAQDADIWAVFDQTKGVGAYTTRRIAIDLALLASDLAPPDVSHSALTFDSADFRLIYEDGEPMKELSAGEFPRPPASSYLWVGPHESGKSEIAHFDLSRATLTVARDVDHVKLRFRFLDLALVLAPQPMLRPAHADCRVVDLGNDHFRDDRPVLVAEFDPQHIFEEAIFRQNIPLPDVADGVTVTFDGQTKDNQGRDDIVNEINTYASDSAKRRGYRQAVQKAKADKDPRAPEFANFCAAFSTAANGASLPPDQQIYVGPFALDPDAMAIARQVERRFATDTVNASIEAMVGRIGQFIADDKSSTTPLLAPPTPTGNGNPGPDGYYLGNALRNETVLEQQEPVYGVFRDQYRREMIEQYYAKPDKKEAWAPFTLGSLDVEYFTLANRPSWQPLSGPKRKPDNDPRDVRAAAVKSKFIKQIVGDDPVGFSELSDARLAQPSRLAFHVNCAPAPNATAEDAGLHYSSGASPQTPNSGRFTYPPLAFTFAALTDWSRHEPAVTLRARKLFSNASGIVPPIGGRAANLADRDVLTYQGITRGLVTAEQRLGEIRAALAKKPTPYETAIEIPARLTLSTAQDAIWFDKRKLPWQVVHEKAGVVPAAAPVEAAGGETVVKPGEPVRRSHEPLWIARLALEGLEPNLRIVDSPDVRPNALTWLKPGDVRQIGQGVPPRGPLAPWFIGSEQMDEATLTAASVNAQLPPGAQIHTPTPPSAGASPAPTPGGSPTPGGAPAPAAGGTPVHGATPIPAPSPPAPLPASEEELCKPPLRDRIWRMLRLLCGRDEDRGALGQLQFFRSTLDAYDRHELVLLSSAYGLPVIGKRMPRAGEPAGSEEAGGLVTNSGQIEPGDEFPVLDADNAQAIQRPQQLRVHELWLSALGGSLIHDTQFLPSAGANDLWGGKIFDGFSIERWRAEIVLGRDIVGEVVYKGYLFPLGHRASLVKLTERLFLRSETLGVKAVLVQRIFVRVGRKTQAYPAVGQPFNGRLWCARNVTMITVQTPDLQDPYEKPNCDPTINATCNPENPVGGRISLGNAPGLAFWPRVNETDEGLVKFDFAIDGAETSMPLIFVDNIAATNGGSLQALVETYRRWGAWLTRRTAALSGQNIRYAQETKTGDCTLKTQSIVLSVHGRLKALPTSSWTGDLTAYDTTAILEGAEQPPFYPSVETAMVRLENVERFSGGAPRPVKVQYDGRYVRFGFPAEATESTKQTNPLEIFLNLRTSLAMGMGNNGDRSGAVGRPESNIVAIGRGNGPIGASGAIIYEISAPTSPNDPNGTADPRGAVPVCENQTLISDPPLAPAFHDLLSLADFFDPQNPYLNNAKGSNVTCGPAGTPGLPVTGVPAPRPPAAGAAAVDTGAVDAIRKVLSTFFSDSAKILGVVTFRELLQFLGFDTAALLGATPVLRETLQFGSGAEASADAQSLVQEIHAHVLAPLQDVVQKLQTQWQTASDALKKQLPGQTVSLAQVFPEIDSGLKDLSSKLTTAQANNDPIGLFLDLSAVYESARTFAAALDRIASNPVARLQAAAVGAVQDLLAQFQEPTTFFKGALTQFGANLAPLLHADTNPINTWLKNLIASQDAGGQELGDALTFALVPPDLVTLAEQTATGIGASLDTVNNQFKADLRLDASNFAKAVIGDILAGKSLDDTFTNFRGAVDQTVKTAVDHAKQGVAAQMGAAQPQAVFILSTELDAFYASVVSDPAVSAGLQDAYRAVKFAADIIQKMVDLKKDIDASNIHDSLNDLAALADMIFGVGEGAPLDQIDQVLKAVFQDLKDKATTAAAVLTPTTDTAFAAEIAACKAYDDLPVKTGELPTPSTLASHQPMTWLDTLLSGVGGAKTTVGAAIDYLNTPDASGRTNRQKIEAAATAAAPIGFDLTRCFALLTDAQALMIGASATDLGLVGDTSKLYCAVVRGLVRMGAAVALIKNADWTNVNKDFVQALANYEQACGQCGSEIGDALKDAISRISAFVQTYDDIIVTGALVAGALDKLAGITDLDSTINGRLTSLSGQWKTYEADIAGALAAIVDVLIAAITDGAGFAKDVTTAVQGVFSTLDTLLMNVGLSLQPEQANVQAALGKLSQEIDGCANLKQIPKGGEAGVATTIRGLLTTPVVAIGTTPTVQSLFTNATQTYQQLAAALHKAEAAVVAEWRALQARANGLPQYLQRAVVLAAQAPLQSFSAFYETNVLGVRNQAAEKINSPLLSLQARRSLFVAPVYNSPPAVDVNDPADNDTIFQALENKDRLAEEVGVLKKIAAYTPPASPPDTVIGNFIQFLDSWTTDQAAPLRIAANVKDLAAEVLKGEILALIDVAAFRDAILDAIALLVPTRAVFSYDFHSTVTEAPDETAIFQAQLGSRFTLTTRVEVDLLEQGKTEFTAAGSLGPFAIKLVGSVVDALTLRFNGASFAASGGAAPRFDISYGSYEVGSDLQFVQRLQSYLTPSDGAGFHIGPLDWTLGIEAGYGVNLGSIGVGEVSFFNIVFDVSADLPFTNSEALFKTSLGTRLSPFTISILPFAGSGYFSLFSAADGIRGFEASFLFGGGGSLQFGPLEAQVQIEVGTFIRVLKVNGVNSTEISGTFLAAGAMTIWIFNFAASLYVSLGEDNGNMYGEAIFTFSFSCGFVDYSYSITVSHNQPQLGSGGGDRAELEPELESFTRFAALNDPNVLSDAIDAFTVAAVLPTRKPPPAKSRPAKPPPAKSPPAKPPPQNVDVVSKAICQSEDWRTYASYFDFDLVQ
jgi:hypothetical protein